MSRTETNYAKARVKLDRYETELHRAFNKWAKQREIVRRYEKRLDKAFTDRAGGLGGRVDWTDFADEPPTVTHE